MRRSGLVALLMMSACLFPALSGLTGESGDAATDVELADAPSADVTDAQKAKDSQPAPDGSDASDAGIPSDGGFCATHPNHTFCEDFDEPNFQARWDGVALSNGGTAVEDNSTAVSLPNAMLASFNFAANGGGHAYATKHFGTASQLKVQVQLLVNPTTIAQIDPVMIFFNPPPAGYTAYEVHIDTGTSHLGYQATPSDGGAQIHLDTSFTNPLSAWHDVEIDLNMTTAAISILVDGVATVQWTIAPLSPTAFDLRLGITTGTNTANAAIATAVHVDNVLVDMQ